MTMTPEQTLERIAHATTNISAQMAENSVKILRENLARLMIENEDLKARIADLEPKPKPAKKA